MEGGFVSRSVAEGGTGVTGPAPEASSSPPQPLTGGASSEQAASAPTPVATVTPRPSSTTLVVEGPSAGNARAEEEPGFSVTRPEDVVQDPPLDPHFPPTAQGGEA